MYQFFNRQGIGLISLVQMLNAFLIILRMLVIIKFGGVDTLGVFSLIASMITIISIPAYFINNQKIHSNLIKEKKNQRDVLLKTALVVLLITSLICSLLVFCFGIFYTELNKLVKYHIWTSGVASAVLFYFIIAIFELQKITAGKFLECYVATLTGSISSLIFYIYFSDSIVSIAYISSVAYITSYITHCIFNVLEYKRLLPFSRQPIVFSALFKLIISSWSLGLIPLINSALDFVTRILGLIYIGPTQLGYYQIVVSIEALVGNIFLGPYYRSILYEYTRSPSFSILILRCKTLIKYIVILSLLQIAIFWGVKSLGFIHKILELMLPIFLAIILRMPSYIWGIFGQALIVDGKHNYVTLVEVISKIITSTFLILLFKINQDGATSYVYSILINSILMLVIVFRVRQHYLVKNSA